MECRDCSSSFEVKDGIVDFRCARKDYYFSPIPKRRMLRLLDAEETTDPIEQLVRSFSEGGGQKSSWLYNLNQYACRVLLYLQPDSTVLDLGFGLGKVIEQIAPHVAKVYTMDLTREHLVLTHKHVRHFDIEEKVTLIAGGDGRYLPFPDNSIDVVFLSGTLGQIPDPDELRDAKNTLLHRGLAKVFPSHRKHNPYYRQIAYLEDVRRILKDDGQVFCEPQNRLNYEHFMERANPHSLSHYRSFFLQFLSNTYSILFRKNPEQRSLYSIFGYNRLFRKVGFQVVDFFSLGFDHGTLRHISPISRGIPYWQKQSPDTLKEKVKHYKYFVPMYGLVASVSEKPQKRHLDQCIAQIEQVLCKDFDGAVITLKDFSMTEKEKAVITGSIDKQDIIIKLPFSFQSLQEEQQNALLLQQAHELFANNLTFWPKCLTVGEFEDIHYFVEECVIGEPLKNILETEGRTARLEMVEDVLERMNPSCSQKMTTRLTDDFYEQEVNQKLEKLNHFILDTGVRKTLHQHFYDLLYGMEFWMGYVHGDFSISNILCTHDDKCKVIDWAGFLSNGMVILDVLYFLNSVQRGCTSGSSLLQPVKLLASDRWPVPEEEDFFQRQCKRCGIAMSERKALAHLYWLRHLTTGVPDHLFYGRLKVKTKIQEFIDYAIVRH